MIFIVMIVIISASISAMEDNKSLIKTSDNKNFRFPQWKIEASRLLHTKQELQAFKEKYSGALPAPIILKTMCQEKLQLFSDALDAHDFSLYFKNLSDKKQNLLLNITGPQEFDSPYIMSQFLSIYCPQDLIEKYLSIMEIAMHLQGLVVFDNCKHKNFRQTSIEKYQRRILPNIKMSYAYSPLYQLYAGYHCLPPLLTNEYSRFSGITSPTLMKLTDAVDTLWLIQNCTESENGIFYCFTSIDPVDKNNRYEQMFIKENKKKLWVMIGADIISQKIIEHTNAIEESIFSKDGKYLVTTSNKERGELILSDLAIDNDRFIGSDILLTGHKGWIGPVCFNKQSDIVAAVSSNSIYMWDIHKKSLLTKFDYPDGRVNIISFNHNDSRFVTTAFHDDIDASSITLWDSSDITNIFIIKTIVYNNQFITGITFTPAGDKLIIETKRSAMIINGLSGDIIMETGTINSEVNKNLSHVNAVLMPYVPILITTARNDQNQCTVTLWDINTKEAIAVLLENQKDLAGIGCNFSGRFVISVTNFFSMITTELYNKSIGECLNWIKNKPNLLQKYLLHRLYYAQKNNESVALHSDSPEYRILQSLPTAPYAVKEMVEKYLIKQKI